MEGRLRAGAGWAQRRSARRAPRSDRRKSRRSCFQKALRKEKCRVSRHGCRRSGAPARTRLRGDHAIQGTSPRRFRETREKRTKLSVLTLRRRETRAERAFPIRRALDPSPRTGWRFRPRVAPKCCAAGPPAAWRMPRRRRRWASRVRHFERSAALVSIAPPSPLSDPSTVGRSAPRPQDPPPGRTHAAEYARRGRSPPA